MKKQLLILILIIAIALYFFIPKNDIKPNIEEKTKSTNIIEKKVETKKVETKIIENKKVDLIDNFVNTKIDIPKNYQVKDNYNKPTNSTINSSKAKSDTNIDVNVDINKETKEFEKIKFKLDKNF